MVKMNDELAALQKRAKAKDARLRRKGALAGEVAAVSPVLSNASVAGMTKREQKDYARKLRLYTQVERYTVLESGEVVSSTVVGQMKARATAKNRIARKEAKRIDDLMAGKYVYKNIGGKRKKISLVDALGGQTIADRLWNIGTRKIKGRPVAIAGNVHNRVAPIIDYKPPTSKANLKAQAKRWSDAGIGRESYNDRMREANRRSAERMLTLMGMTELSELFDINNPDRLTDDQMDVLFIASDFFNVLEVEYDPSQIRGYSSFQDMSNAEIRQAFTTQALGMSGNEMYISTRIEYIQQTI